jgi:hypothetical protein
LAAALALVPLLALASCGDDDDAGATASAAPDATTTTVHDVATTAAPETATTTTTTSAAPPTTTGAVAAEGTAFPAGSPEAEAQAAYEVVFDSAASFVQKAPHLEGAESLETTLADYAAMGARFGGFTLDVTAVVVSGPSAAVTYDLYFGTTKRYPGLPGTIENRDGTWTVTRGELCSFTALAGVECP